jgi:hypothetical protein
MAGKILISSPINTAVRTSGTTCDVLFIGMLSLLLMLRWRTGLLAPRLPSLALSLRKGSVLEEWTTAPGCATIAIYD